MKRSSTLLKTKRFREDLAFCSFYYRPKRFRFPYSYDTSNNTWHSIAVKFIKPELTVFLDGVQREVKEYNDINQNIVLNGALTLGYYKNRSGNEHHFEGEISEVDKLSLETLIKRKSMQELISHVCPSHKGDWSSKPWTGLHLATDSALTCAARGK